MAINIIDLLDRELSKTSKEFNDKEISLTEEELLEINNEISELITKKTKLLDHITEMKKVIDTIELSTVNRIVSNSRLLNNNTLYEICDICDYKAKTKRALTAHKNHKHMHKYSKNSIINTIDQPNDINNLDPNESSISTTINTNNETIDSTSNDELTISKKKSTRKTK
jgi:hypothetical protein